MKTGAKLSALALALSLVACGGDDGSEGGPGDGTRLDVEPHGEAGPLGGAPSGRLSKRLTVDMLQASVPVVAGKGADGKPIRWAVQAKGGRRDGFAQGAFGGALGRADYHNVTEENTVPSALYAKLMDDMARNVCDQMARADLAGGDASSRTLTRFAGAGSDAEVRKNVRSLILRFHGESVSEDGPEVASLVTLHRDVEGAAAAKKLENPAMEGWRAVCIALVSAPGFHLY